MWVLGHVATQVNEIADLLANIGRFSEIVYEKLPRFDANRLIERKVREAWQWEWTSANPGTQLNKIKENVCKWKDRSDQYEQRVLTKLRIGHTRLTHGYLLPYQNSPVCSRCKENLTITHILLECKKLANLRKKYDIEEELKEVLKKQ